MSRMPAGIVAESIETMRRMRGYILNGDPSQAETGLEAAARLAKAVGALLATCASEESNAIQVANVCRCLDAATTYRDSEAVARTSRPSEQIATRLWGLAQHMRGSVARGRFIVLSHRIISREMLGSELEDHVVVAPLSTDILYAEVVSQSLQHMTGKGYTLVPAAVSRDGGQVILPAYAAITSPARIFVDGSDTGVTGDALRGALSVAQGSSPNQAGKTVS